jgi:hypothetical protein
MNSLWLSCLSFLTLAGGNAVAAMYRCDGPKNPDGSASILYQAKPCPAQFQSKEIVEVKAPTLNASERARIIRDASSNTKTSTVRRRAARRNSSNSAGQGKRRSRKSVGRYKFRNLPSVAQAGCPPTYENPGVYVVGNKWMRDQYNQRSKVRNGMYAAYEHYKSLPTKTYLKNQGLWPKHCPQ